MSRLPTTNRLQAQAYAQNEDYLPELIRNTEEVILATGGTIVLLKKVSQGSSELDTRGTQSQRGIMNERKIDKEITTVIETPYWRQIKIGIPALIDLNGREEKGVGRRSGGTANVTIARLTIEKLGVSINVTEDQFNIYGERYRITSHDYDTKILDTHTAVIYSVEKV